MNVMLCAVITFLMRARALSKVAGGHDSSIGRSDFSRHI